MLQSIALVRQQVAAVLQVRMQMLSKIIKLMLMLMLMLMLSPMIKSILMPSIMINHAADAEIK